MYGDGKGNFDVANALKLPSVDGWGVITDFDIYDLDNETREQLNSILQRMNVHELNLIEN